MSEWDYSSKKYLKKKNIKIITMYFSLQISQATANLLHCKHPQCLSSEFSGH